MFSTDTRKSETKSSFTHPIYALRLVRVCIAFLKYLPWFRTDEAVQHGFGSRLESVFITAPAASKVVKSDSKNNHLKTLVLIRHKRCRLFCPTKISTSKWMIKGDVTTCLNVKFIFMLKKYSEILFLTSMRFLSLSGNCSSRVCFVGEKN